MIDELKWMPNATRECIRQWTENLHTEAKRLVIQDGTHASLLFFFDKESGLISVNPVPQDVDLAQLNEAVRNTIGENDLYGVVFIGETWTYFVKDNDHTAFQLLDGEMKVSDLNADDKKEALMIRMENSDGDSLVCLDEIVRAEDGISLKEGRIAPVSQRAWFTQQA